MKLTKSSVCLFEIIIVIFKNWQVKQFSSITLIKLYFRHIAIIIILYLLSLKLKSIGKQTTITPCFTARWQVFIYSSPKPIDSDMCQSFGTNFADVFRTINTGSDVRVSCTEKRFRKFKQSQYLFKLKANTHNVLVFVVKLKNIITGS